MGSGGVYGRRKSSGRPPSAASKTPSDSAKDEPQKRTSSKRKRAVTRTPRNIHGASVQAKEHHEADAAALDHGVNFLDKYIAALSALSPPDSSVDPAEALANLSIDVPHAKRDWSSVDTVGVMTELIDENPKPTLEYALGVLGVSEIPKSLEERQRSHGARAFTAHFRNRSIRKKRELLEMPPVAPPKPAASSSEPTAEDEHKNRPPEQPEVDETLKASPKTNDPVNIEPVAEQDPVEIVSSAGLEQPGRSSSGDMQDIDNEEKKDDVRPVSPVQCTKNAATIPEKSPTDVNIPSAAANASTIAAKAPTIDAKPPPIAAEPPPTAAISLPSVKPSLVTAKSPLPISKSSPPVVVPLQSTTKLVSATTTPPPTSEPKQNQSTAQTPSEKIPIIQDDLKKAKETPSHKADVKKDAEMTTTEPNVVKVPRTYAHAPSLEPPEKPSSEVDIESKKESAVEHSTHPMKEAHPNPPKEHKEDAQQAVPKKTPSLGPASSAHTPVSDSRTKHSKWRTAKEITKETDISLHHGMDKMQGKGQPAMAKVLQDARVETTSGKPLPQQAGRDDMREKSVDSKNIPACAVVPGSPPMVKAVPESAEHSSNVPEKPVPAVVTTKVSAASDKMTLAKRTEIKETTNSTPVTCQGEPKKDSARPKSIESGGVPPAKHSVVALERRLPVKQPRSRFSEAPKSTAVQGSSQNQKASMDDPRTTAAPVDQRKPLKKEILKERAEEAEMRATELLGEASEVNTAPDQSKQSRKELAGTSKSRKLTEKVRDKRSGPRRASSVIDDYAPTQPRQTRLRRESSHLRGDGSSILAGRDPFIIECFNVWKEISQDKITIPFRKPVTVRDAPGYFEVVKKPMDLSTVRLHLEDKTIGTPEDFMEEMMLICSNAMLFNDAESDLYDLAVDLRRLMRKAIRPVVRRWRESRPKDERSEEGNGEGIEKGSDESDSDESEVPISARGAVGRGNTRYPSRRSSGVGASSSHKDSGGSPRGTSAKKKKSGRGRKRTTQELSDGDDGPDYVQVPRRSSGRGGRRGSASGRGGSERGGKAAGAASSRKGRKGGRGGSSAALDDDREARKIKKRRLSGRRKRGEED